MGRELGGSAGGASFCCQGQACHGQGVRLGLLTVVETDGATGLCRCRTRAGVTDERAVKTWGEDHAEREASAL